MFIGTKQSYLIKQILNHNINHLRFQNTVILDKLSYSFSTCDIHPPHMSGNTSVNSCDFGLSLPIVALVILYII